MSRQPVLHRKMRPATAFVALGESGLRAVHDRLDALQHRDEVEDVHELRVAVRHLRAVAWAFGPVLPRQVKARWKQALHDVADAAGDVRDWDVFIAETLAPALEKQPEDALLVALIDIAQAKRTVAHAEMMTRLSRYRHPGQARNLRPEAHSQGTRQGPRAGPHRARREDRTRPQAAYRQQAPALRDRVAVGRAARPLPQAPAQEAGGAAVRTGRRDRRRRGAPAAVRMPLGRSTHRLPGMIRGPSGPLSDLRQYCT
jgi:inorganic triphosphatase YgiF